MQRFDLLHEGSQFLVVMFDELAMIVLADGIGLDELCRHPSRAQLAAFEKRRVLVVADDEFHASASDIDHEMRLRPQLNRMPHREVNQPRFIAGADDADMQSKLPPDALDKIAAVLGLANRASRHGHNFLRLPLLRRFLKPLQNRNRPVHRVGRKPARWKAQPCQVQPVPSNARAW